jgi:hypothetical protein
MSKGQLGYQEVQDAPSYLPGTIPSESDRWLQKYKARYMMNVLRQLPPAHRAAVYRSGHLPHLLGLRPKKLKFNGRLKKPSIL